MRKTPGAMPGALQEGNEFRIRLGSPSCLIDGQVSVGQRNAPEALRVVTVGQPRNLAGRLRCREAGRLVSAERDACRALGCGGYWVGAGPCPDQVTWHRFLARTRRPTRLDGLDSIRGGARVAQWQGTTLPMAHTISGISLAVFHRRWRSAPDEIRPAAPPRAAALRSTGPADHRTRKR